MPYWFVNLRRSLLCCFCMSSALVALVEYNLLFCRYYFALTKCDNQYLVFDNLCTNADFGFSIIRTNVKRKKNCEYCKCNKFSIIYNQVFHFYTVFVLNHFTNWRNEFNYKLKLYILMRHDIIYLKVVSVSVMNFT